MKHIRTLFVIFTLLTLIFWGKQRVSAYEFPIVELGNCRDVRECHLYCEIPSHKAACWSYSVYETVSVLGDESPETKVSALGITFPIAELGNCANVATCKSFCSLADNQTVCHTFAQNHGLTKKERLVEKAQTDLGCTTLEECKAFCSSETNHDTCREFAQRYHLRTVVKNRMLELAQKELGCTTVEECRAFCAKPENRTKCAALTKKMGKGDTRKEELLKKAKQELGCTSFENCREFCQNKENADKCRNFGSTIKMGVKDRIMEKGDCKTAEECKKVCESDPDKCPGFPKKLNRTPVKSQSPNSGPGSINSTDSELNQIDEDLNTDSGEFDSDLDQDLNDL